MEAFNSGDIETYADLLADDIVWHQIGAPTLNGKQEIAETHAKPGRRAGSITTTSTTSSATTSTSIAMVEAHATRADGQTLDYRTTEIVHMRDGKVTERWAFSDDTQRIIDFFAS